MVAQFYHMQNYDTSLKFILLELKVRDLEMKCKRGSADPLKLDVSIYY